MRQQAACEGNGSEGARAAHRLLPSFHSSPLCLAGGGSFGERAKASATRLMEAEAGLALRNSDQVECADLHKCPLCRAHRQAEWLLFLDFNGGGVVVAGWGRLCQLL